MPESETYLSPFSWRYGTPAMRQIWSEHHKRLLWRQIWVALADTQAKFGLVTPDQVEDLRRHIQEIDLMRVQAIEAVVQHDLMAEVQTYAQQCPLGGGIIHLGATSMDIEDNTDALRLRSALDLIIESLRTLLQTLSRLIERHADTPLMAFTHLQPAEPSTLGYRLALYGQDLWEDFRAIRTIRLAIKGKGFKGAVGTSASYAELIGHENLAVFEQSLSEKLNLPFFPVASQTYPRKQDFTILSALASLGASLYKFAFDIRLLQSPPIGELAEPFGDKQIGSSAMPFKRNPIQAEKINSLGRYLASLPRIAWDNAAHSLLERTLDDSANRRIILPEAFLAADEMLKTAQIILTDLRVDENAIKRNLETYGPFAATERVLMALVKAGADRQEMHERIRLHAMQAWQVLQEGNSNPLAELIAGDEVFCRHLAGTEIRQLLAYRLHIGDAPQKARGLAKMIWEEIK